VGAQLHAIRRKLRKTIHFHSLTGMETKFKTYMGKQKLTWDKFTIRTVKALKILLTTKRGYYVFALSLKVRQSNLPVRY
jgi:hypothetical protein